MTIPTRDELIERASRFGVPDVSHISHDDVCALMADFALRAVADELEALRKRSDDGGWVMQNGHFMSFISSVIDARLAALRASRGEAAPRLEGEMAKAKETSRG